MAASSLTFCIQSGQSWIPYMPPSLRRPRGSRACSNTKRWTSSRVNPSLAIVAACSGPSTTRSWLCEKYQPTFEPSVAAVSATLLRMPAAVVPTWSLTLCGASPPNIVTTLCSAANPRLMCSGAHGLAVSASAMAHEKFAGSPRAAGKRDLAGAPRGGQAVAARPAAAHVHQHEPDGAPDGGVGAEAGAEAPRARVHADVGRGGPVEDQQRRHRMRGRLHAVEV